MKTVTVEIRDHLTFIAAVVIQTTGLTNNEEAYLFYRGGFYGQKSVILLRLDT